MSWLRRLIGVLFAIGVATGAGLVFLPLVAFFDPVTRSSGVALMELAVAATVDAEVLEGLDTNSLTALTSFMWMVVMSVCVAPLVAVALIGEVAKVHWFVWYAGGTGAVAASAPWLIRAALRLPRAGDYNSVELRFALIFFFTGAISGSIYWFLAGRSAGNRRAI
jgi:hypothetical protein